mgnify:CR=1 FL=1
MIYIALFLTALLAGIAGYYLEDWRQKRRDRKEVFTRAKARMERARAGVTTRLSVSPDGENWVDLDPAEFAQHTGISHIEVHDGWLDPENPVCPGCKYCSGLSEMSEKDFDY